MARVYDNYSSLIDFTRASYGTALRPISYGDELVTNGTFDTDISGWSQERSANVTVANGIATHNPVAGINSLVQGLDLTVGKLYLASITITESTQLSSATFQTTPNSDGTSFASVNLSITSTGSYSKVFIATANDAYLTVNAGDNDSYSFDNISVREVLFDQPNGTLTLFNHPTNIPRIEYDADGNRLGLLVEETRTNLITYSEDFSNAAWSGYYQKPTFVTGQLAPDGSYTAMKWNTSTTTGSGSGAAGGLVFGQGQATAGVTYTASVWLKASASVNMAFGLTDGATTVITLTNEWVRYTYTGQSVNFLRLFQLNENTNEDIDIYIWGAQTEVGSFPTSYIPTSGSTATRSADVASIGVSEFGYNQSEGTVVVEFQNTEINSTDRMVSINDGSGNNAYQIQHVNGTSTSGRIRVGATDYMFSNRTAISSGKAALLYSEEYAQFATDGSANSQDTTVATATMTSLNIGHINGASQCNGHIKSLRYFPRKLTESQLEALTS